MLQLLVDLVINFYLRDATLARVLTMALCLSVSVSVCHKSVFYCSGWTDRAGFWHGGFFRSVLHCVLKEIQVSTKIRVLPSGTFF